jgi:cytochrome c oxidase assembly factor 4
MNQSCDDVDVMIAKGKCAKEYYALEECLADTDRDWTRCQTVVQRLKECHDQSGPPRIR